MLYESLGIRPSIPIDVYLSATRAKRLSFGPDHATKRDSSQNPSQIRLKAVEHVLAVFNRTRAERKVAEADIQEAFSKVIEPVEATTEIQETKPEPSLLWALVAPKYLILMASDRSLFEVQTTS